MLKREIMKITLGFVLVLCLVMSATTLAVEIKINDETNDKYNLKGLQEVKLKGENRIYMEVGGAELFFDENLEDIYISDELKVDTLGSRLTISSPKNGFFNWFNSDNHKIVIGTKESYRLININAGGITLSGILYADEINIAAAGVDMSGEYYCQDIELNGAGINFKGYVEGEYIKINGAGIDLDLEVLGLKDIKINGVGIDATLKYMDTWVGIRHISLNGVGGDLNAIVPLNNNEQSSQLDIDTNGIISTEIDYY